MLCLIVKLYSNEKIKLKNEKIFRGSLQEVADNSSLRVYELKRKLFSKDNFVSLIFSFSLLFTTIDICTV